MANQVLYTREIVEPDRSGPRRVLLDALAEVFSPGDRVAVKLHMGEERNRTALSPSLVKGVVQALESLGARPFLFDSPVVYKSRRDTASGYLELARERGFTEEDIGCPVLVSNVSVPLQGEKVVYELCKELADADGVCLLTHVKGHPCTGFGGSIKNIGMGAMSRETKGMIHDGGKPVYESGCNECMKCVENCPTSNIAIRDGRPEFDVSFCVGCSNCALVCDQDAIRPVLDHFPRMLSEATALALPRFGKTYFINCLIDITELCDCIGDSGRILCGDIGFVMGRSICAVEQASYDLIVKKAGRDVFFDRHHISPLEHIKHLQSFLAESGYSLLEAR